MIERKARRFCADCGDSNVPLHNNFCQNCFWKLNHLADPDYSEKELNICKDCSAVKLISGWTNPSSEIDMYHMISMDASKSLRLSESATVNDISFIDVDWEIPKPKLQVIYELKDESMADFSMHSEEYNLSFLFHKGICTLCVKKKTGTGEITIQFRAYKRNLDENEREWVNNKIRSLIENSKGEASNYYISSIDDNHGGLDIQVGNELLAEKILKELKNKWIGEAEKNYKLQTEDREGKRVYSVTHLYRIPHIKPNEFIDYKNSLYKSKSISRDFVVIYDLKSLEKKNIKNWKELKIADPQPEIVKKLIISEDISVKSYLIMDPRDFQTEEINIDEFPIKLTIGEEIELLYWKEKYYQDENL